MPDPSMLVRSRNPRRRSSALVVATLLSGLAFLTIAPAASAGAACGATGNRTITGAFTGEDGRSVSGFVGLTVLNSAGRAIGADGCEIVLGGYGTFVDSVNPHPTSPGCCFALPTGGDPSGAGDRTWSISIPNNAATVWVEAYPKSSTPNAQGQAHQTDYRRYGGALRRGVPASSGAHLDIRLPLNCASGGTAPTLVGTATRNGRPADISTVAAFPRAAEFSGQILGFVTTPVVVNGSTFTLPSLAPNQSYALEIRAMDGGHWWFEHDYGSGVPVRSCAGSPVRASFELPGSGFGGDRAILTGVTGAVGSGPGVASTGTSTNQIFFRGGDGALWTQTEGSPAYPLDGQILGEPDAVLSASGRIDVVARGTDNRIFWKVFNGGWGPWVPLGGGTGFAPAITSWGSGRLDVAATGLDGQLWMRSSANGGASWFPWTPFGGVLTAGPDITSWGPNRLDVAARGGDGAVWHRAWSSGWQPWESMGGYTLGGPAAASYQPGVLEVVARGGDNRVYLAGWHANGYRTWTPLGAGLTDADPEVVATPGSTGLSVYARGLDGAIWRAARVSPNVPFGGWQSVGP